MATHGGSGKGKGVNRRAYPGDPRPHIVPGRIAQSDTRSHRYFDYIEEMDRLTFEERKKAAYNDWMDFRGRLFGKGGEGGIKPVQTANAAEYSDIPKQLWNPKARFSADHYANEFGFDYIGDFAHFAETLWLNYKEVKHQKPKKPRVLPKITHTRSAGRGRVVPIARKPHPVPQAVKTEIREDSTKKVWVKPHTRGCPR